MIPHKFLHGSRSRFGCLVRSYILPVAICFGGSAVCSAATYTTPRALNVGDIYDLRRDGWVNQSPSGYEGDVQPKADANAGTANDNPYYRRHNVARAWATGTGYWFTDVDQFAGEPDPAGEQWVDYVPPFEILGPGRYSIEAGYRWSASRASYPAVYAVHHLGGTNITLQSQRVGSAGASIAYVALGQFDMVPDSFLRVEDTGVESITFGNVRFRLIAPFPKLQITTAEGFAHLRWPTNAANYRLECATDLTPPTPWLPIPETPAVEADQFRISVPMFEGQKYFRLITQ